LYDYFKFAPVFACASSEGLVEVIYSFTFQQGHLGCQVRNWFNCVCLWNHSVYGQKSIHAEEYPH